MKTVFSTNYLALRAKHPEAFAIRPCDGGFTGFVASAEEDLSSEFIEAEYKKTFSES